MANLSIDEYSYDLPADLVADKPLPERDQSRMLVIDGSSGSIKHSRFDQLPLFLQKGDVLVVNDTKVIPAKIVARRGSGGVIRLLLIKPEATRPGLWQAMVSPIKRLKPGEILTVDTADGETYHLKIADIITAEDNFKRLLVDLGDGAKVFQLLNKIGSAPLPPYIARNKVAFEAPETLEEPPGESTALPANKEEAENMRSYDLERYQTVFAHAPGAVAAPTAGLHFSEDLLKTLEAKGIIVCRLTLHVGPGTFKPVETSLDEHYIEPEIYFVPEKTVQEVNLAKKEHRRVIAIGTTSLRALESAATGESIRIVEGEATHLFVKPGYDFKVVDALITNFHLSRSSLLVLVAAFAGRNLIMHAYQEAISANYRFYSYGDAMFISDRPPLSQNGKVNVNPEQTT